MGWATRIGGAGLALALVGLTAPVAAGQDGESWEALGEALFFDPNLSQDRTQACVTCHDPNSGFVDPRETDLGRAVSLGDDGHSLGTRNAPTASYAALTPPFHLNAKGKWVGGQFLDGRATDLAAQAGGPPLNPVEMAMPDKLAVVARLQENPEYVATLKTLAGTDVFDDDARAYGAMTQALAAYERTPEFAPFDSKYDRYLRGDYQLTREEDLGRLLFFSQQFTNCNLCHQLKTSPVDPAETFSNYEYHNIGVPTNPLLAHMSGPDQGLRDNPAVSDPAQAGKFKVPTLRNVAVTGPYMHNGVFTNLRTVVLFYNKYNSKSEARQINPETGQPFAPPEVDGTLSMEELTTGPALEDDRIDALVAFLKTLTDARYEGLVE
ncbi:cytochrome-c peroxidase [Antarcticimicrobium sediminis]|uniref:Methylamine utilization protein MauG n=1 Tax=Antarcticimicrobium sediminis TaxID=2546227 RepID=A0A4R5EU70_9RHOB|nr:cytochrome c peroxidase [Antarcticimicrobium sediminis]TDE38419.1 methylamine utilization protein MauG [Antarcticimicrobium sediminis]